MVRDRASVQTLPCVLQEDVISLDQQLIYGPTLVPDRRGNRGVHDLIQQGRIDARVGQGGQEPAMGDAGGGDGAHQQDQNRGGDQNQPQSSSVFHSFFSFPGLRRCPDLIRRDTGVQGGKDLLVSFVFCHFDSSSKA